MKGRHSTLNNQKGFTLIEIIAVLVLLGILAAVAVPKYMDLTNDARDKALDAGIAEMNSRESMIWSKVKLTSEPANDAAMDTAVRGHADYSDDLGGDYTTAGWAGATSGTLAFQTGTDVILTRAPATLASPAKWSRPKAAAAAGE